ncbi:MAG: hypothetical protein CBB97_17665 [Candidatus Endolissoclinum sp. TMED37]|nr:MAG: hypothetical protein CBB97_17665 [Candidatus Endolissoclinum sp. TMED37]|tara:strand:- start:1310 stop:1504 length:195 start_codon:yes stop_codon:yes gene_type:complete
MIGLLLNFPISLQVELDKVQFKRNGNAILMLIPEKMNIGKGQNVKRRIKRLGRVLGEQVTLQVV